METTTDAYDIDISIELEISFPPIYNLSVLCSGSLNSQKSVACYSTISTLTVFGIMKYHKLFGRVILLFFLFCTIYYNSLQHK